MNSKSYSVGFQLLAGILLVSCYIICVRGNGSKAYDATIYKPGMCPPSDPQMHCYEIKDLCKKDCDCPRTEKCCFQEDCGHSCKPANKTGTTCEQPIAPSTKYGTCPGPDLKICAGCIDQCNSDCECDGNQLCCPQPGCGNECKNPVSSGWGA